MTVTVLLTSNHDDYFKDVVKVLSLPEGFRYRFRYELKYLSEDIREPDILEELDGKGLILFLPVGADRSATNLIPLVFLDELSVEVPQGSLAYVNFTIGKMVVDSALPPGDAFDQFVRAVGGGGYLEGSFMGCLDPDDDPDEVFGLQESTFPIKTWRSKVDTLRDYDRLDNSVFIKLNRLSAEGKDVLGEGVRRPSLKGGTTYTLEFLHDRPELPSPDDTSPDDIKIGEQPTVRLLLPSDIISPILTEQPILGRYDLNRLHISCKKSLQDKETYLIFDGERGWTRYFPRLEMPISVTRRWTRQNKMLVVLGIGLVLIGAIDILVRGWAASGGNIQQILKRPVAFLLKGWDGSLLSPLLGLLGLVLALFVSLVRE